MRPEQTARARKSPEWREAYEQGATDACAILEQSELGTINDEQVREVAAAIIAATAATVRAYLRHGTLDARADRPSLATVRAHDESLAYASVLALRSTHASKRTVATVARGQIQEIDARLREPLLPEHERAYLLDASRAWHALLEIITPAGEVCDG